MGDVATRILSVPQVTLDSLDELIADRITFAKIDVERRELNALRGMRNLIRRDRPIIIYENDTADIQDFLKYIDYQTFDQAATTGVLGITANVLAVPSLRVAEVERFLPTRQEIFDLICLPEFLVT